MKYLITTIAAALLVGCKKPEPPEISIFEAAHGGNIEAVKQHIAAGREVDAKKTDGKTPLFLASLPFVHTDNPVEIVELLIENGADVNAKDRIGSTPLHHAETMQIAKLLIAKGGDVNAKDKDGDTPLHHAASDKEITKVLIENGADVNAKNEEGLTALHEASFSFADVDVAVEIVELLIAKGADVNAQDDDGSTPLDAAIDGDITETADLLRKHGGKTGEELKAAGN